jgi:hypothetical protein
MQIECRNSDALIVNKLPDGSRVIVDPASETVYALNAAAGAAWDACSEPTTLPGVTQHMKLSFDPNTSEELAEQAILELEEKKLVRVSQTTTRRQMLGRLSAAAALPLVVSLTLTEQRAYAYNTGSGIGGPPTPIKLPIILPPPPPPPPPPAPIRLPL